MLKIKLLLSLFLFSVLFENGSAISTQKTCRVNSDCSSGKICNVDPSTKPQFKCLTGFSQKCNNTVECANNMICSNSICGCSNGTYYDNLRAYCIPKQLFGQRCDNKRQCGPGLICSTLCIDGTICAGMATYVCLLDQGGICGSVNDCGNILYCINGVCGCQAPLIGYSQSINSCINLAPGLGTKCSQDSDCDLPTYSCDDLTHTCRLGLDQNCIMYSDCVNNLKCGYSATCGCDPGSEYYSDNNCHQLKLFKESCQSNLECSNSLICNNLNNSNQIAYTCLKDYGMQCYSDSDCVNNLMCDGTCGCSNSMDMIYDHLIYGCVYKQTNSTANIESGYACQTSSNCSPGLVCTADFVCLTGFGGSCISDTECANSLKCASNGTCGCENPLTNVIYNETQLVYNSESNTCILQNVSRAGDTCQNTSDCSSFDGTNNGLTCDLLMNLCARGYNSICLENSDCASGFLSGLCLCNTETQFYNYTRGQCVQYKQFHESCTEYSQCQGGLVCERVPYLNHKIHTCLKPYGDSCLSTSECGNNMACINGICGCNTFYEANVFDCLPKGRFGSRCSADNQCGSNLACDIEPAGGRSFSCSRLPGAMCNSYKNCVNNLDCIKTGNHAVCSCQAGQHFNKANEACSFKPQIN